MSTTQKYLWTRAELVDQMRRDLADLNRARLNSNLDAVQSAHLDGLISLTALYVTRAAETGPVEDGEL